MRASAKPLSEFNRRGYRLDRIKADPGALTLLERERAGVRRLPASLTEAIAALAPSEPLRAAFGDRLFDAFLAVRKMEAETFADAGDEELAARHRFAY